MIRKRWTILGVDESVIVTVRDFAKHNGYTTAKALKELVKKGKKSKEK